ncbi:MAG: nuclear transport factor 2 family protein [Burkholderiaceae bacterium]
MRATTWLAALTVALMATASVTAQEQRKADHDQLRELLKRGAEALNTRKLDVMAPYLHPDFTVVTVDNRKLRGFPEFKQYWNNLFEGENAILKSIETKPEADELTRFLDDSAAITFGTSDDRYTFNDGDVRQMKSRWSAVVRKDADTWKLVSVHFSANVLDNPVLDVAKNAVRNTALIAGAIGVAIGLVAALLLRRRKP